MLQFQLIILCRFIICRSLSHFSQLDIYILYCRLKPKVLTHHVGVQFTLKPDSPVEQIKDLKILCDEEKSSVEESLLDQRCGLCGITIIFRGIGSTETNESKLNHSSTKIWHKKRKT